MTRWSPDARRRLREAALDLYAAIGYEETTVAAIAARAGLTERTFFRHFSDKREVLFDGSDELNQRVADAVAAAPRDALPLDAVVAGIAAVGAFFTRERRPDARLRRKIISTHGALRERELMKLEALGDALEAVLRARSSRELARLAAEAGVAMFRETFDRWVERDGDWLSIAKGVRRDLGDLTASSNRPSH